MRGCRNTSALFRQVCSIRKEERALVFLVEKPPKILEGQYHGFSLVHPHFSCTFWLSTAAVIGESAKAKAGVIQFILTGSVGTPGKMRLKATESSSCEGKRASSYRTVVILDGNDVMVKLVFSCSFRDSSNR